MEGDHRRRHHRQRPARLPGTRDAGGRGENLRAGGGAAAGESRFDERARIEGSRRRLERARQPPSGFEFFDRTAEQATGLAAPGTRRDHQHRHAHRRASGQGRGNVAHGVHRHCAARPGNQVHMKRPLEGITVVALEQVIAGPFCTRQLAELGARVIKIERPQGGDAARGYDSTVKGLSSHFFWVNRSKESLCLDVKHPDAKPVLEKLIGMADVFVQNLAPGAAERLGLGAAELRAKHPRLIWCGISGYGPAGPYADKKAYDLLVQCEAGLLSVTGSADAPAKAGIPVADIAAGMYAFSSILAALIRRGRDGEGATLDITMFEALG